MGNRFGMGEVWLRKDSTLKTCWVCISRFQHVNVSFNLYNQHGFQTHSFFCSAAFDTQGDGGDTTTLNKDSFDEFIRQQKQQQRAVLVMFHVSWCKACQRTFPIFSAASDAVLSSEVPMAFAHVECTDDKTLCQRFQVQGYPTIKLLDKKGLCIKSL